MFNSDSSTDEWELETNEYVQIPNDEYMYLLDDSKMLYALRKIGVLTTKVEGEAREWLQEEGDVNA